MFDPKTQALLNRIRQHELHYTYLMLVFNSLGLIALALFGIYFAMGPRI